MSKSPVYVGLIHCSREAKLNTKNNNNMSLALLGWLGWEHGSRPPEHQ